MATNQEERIKFLKLQHEAFKKEKKKISIISSRI
jgi:hypothetical protein